MFTIKRNFVRLAVFAAVLILISSCLFMTSASAKEDSAVYAGVSHNCALGAVNLEQSGVNGFIDSIENYDFTDPQNSGMIMVSLTTSISWEGTVTVPDGLFVGICVGEADDFLTVKGTWQAEGSGGIYVFNCGYDYMDTYDENGAYTGGEYYVSLEQSLHDFYTDFCEYYGVISPTEA